MVIGIVLVIFGAILSIVGLFIVGIPLALFGGILLVVSFMKNTAAATAAGAKSAYRAATTKACPECKTRIAADAIVCGHCQYRYAALGA